MSKAKELSQNRRPLLAGKVFELTWEDIETIADLTFEEFKERKEK